MRRPLEIALDEWGALERHHLDCRHHLFGAKGRWRRWRYASLWPYATAWSAASALDAAAGTPGLRGGTAWLAGLSCYARPGELAGTGTLGLEAMVRPPLGPGGVRYYDDNAWIGLAALRAHVLGESDGFLELARRLLAFCVSGWSERADWALPGGICWHEAPNRGGRNTCANAPTAALAARLARPSPDDAAAAWATRIYSWTATALLRPSGLYGDHLRPDGSLEPTEWSYNQGAMIGAGVALAEATGEPRYLDEARALARRALDHFAAPGRLDREPGVFVAVFIRNLFALDRVDPLPGARAFAAKWANDQRSGAPTPAGPDGVLARAPLLEVEALLSGAPAAP
ncbi:MAG: hypothetical protein M0004_03710 [Actinomycetota bacterium]|nr:hypothetical protein [Actinomycetota bacterium]